MSLDWAALPPQIQQFKQQILATAQPSLSIELQGKAAVTRWQSQIGGVPYLPLTESYPMDRKGKPLKLLAQMNFAEMPSLPDYPSCGILQFYIGGDDLYGADFDDLQKQADFRVMFFEQVIEDESLLHQDFSEYFAQFDADYYSPVEGQSALSFAVETQYISTDDENFAPRVLSMDDIWDYEEQFEGADLQEDWLDPYNEQFPSTGHRLGGYPYFTQSDPREYRDELKAYVLLLQIDSDRANGIDIMWGDVGVGNFFIDPEDLKKRDFSKVAYNWDCG